MNITKHQIFSALVAMISFLGVVAGNVLTNDIAQMLENNETWLWIAFFAGLAVTIGIHFWPNPTPESIILSEKEIHTLMDRRDEQRHHYLQRLCKQFRHLPMRVLDPESASAENEQWVGLADVYVAMNTTTRKGGEGAALQRGKGAELHSEDEGQLGVLEAVIQEPRLVLLGDPGGGKSTFVNHLAYCLAHHGVAPREDLLDQLTQWPDDWAGLLPVPVALREVAAWLQDTWCPTRKAGLLTAYLAHGSNSGIWPTFMGRWSHVYRRGERSSCSMGWMTCGSLYDRCWPLRLF